MFFIGPLEARAVFDLALFLVNRLRGVMGFREYQIMAERLMYVVFGKTYHEAVGVSISKIA